MNYTIVIWHGEAGSLFYIVDADAPDDEQPAVVYTAHSYEEAVAIQKDLGTEATELRAALRRFTGTTQYHRHWSGLRFTDGVAFLAARARAQWLIDRIGAWQPQALRDPALCEFQLWELFIMPGQAPRLVCSRDSEDVAFSEEVKEIDCPLEYVRLYVEDGVVLLPAEHVARR